MTPRVHRVRSVKPECHYVSARGCVAAGFRSASQASCEDEAMTVLSTPLFAFFTVLTVLTVLVLAAACAGWVLVQVFRPDAG